MVIVDSGAVGTVAMWGSVLAAGLATALTVTPWRRSAGRLGVTALVLSAAALGALGWALLTGDFALANVAETTARRAVGRTAWPRCGAVTPGRCSCGAG